MTGTGTQTDPYCPDNWGEFVTAIGKSGAYVSCPENAVWDMNDVLPSGISSNIKVKCSYIYGNGLTIKNLTFRSGYFVHDSSEIATCFYNIKFLNFYKEASSDYLFYTSYRSKFYWYDCTFSGIVDNMFFIRNTEKSTYHFERCSLNLIFNNNSFIYQYQSYTTVYAPIFIDCNIKLDGNSNSPYYSNYRQNLMECKNCLITGTLPFKCLKFYRDSNATLRSSVLDIEIPEGRTIDLDSNITNTYPLPNSIINSDKIEGNVSNLITRVTTAQMSDAEYLASIGFPIGVD